jgi:hypothetical protein
MKRQLTCAVVFLLVCWGAQARADLLAKQCVIDLGGQPRTILADETRVTALVFLGTQCPISNRAIPTLNELYTSHGCDPLDFFIVVSDPTISRKDVISYRDQYKIKVPILFDASGTLAQQLKPTHTPEAFVLDASGAIRYQGRIDDSFAALGKVNQVVKSHDLADAIDALLAGKTIAHEKTEAVGCPFEFLDAKSSDANSPDAKLTYTRDIAPIINANCVQCHREGQIAPFPLTSYTDVSKRAKFIAEVTESRYMPPWKPAEGFGHFVGEHRLSGRDISLIKQWVASGSLAGDAADSPPLPKFDASTGLRSPDLRATMPEPFTFPADGRYI